MQSESTRRRGFLKAPVEPRWCEQCYQRYTPKSTTQRFCDWTCWKDSLPSPLERFWSNVDKSAGPEACWPWLGRRMPNQYGLAYWSDPQWVYAHRLSYYIAHGCWPVPQANHHCDHPWCVNPAHLYAGTQQENVRDMYDRRRWRRTPRRRRVVRGEQNGQSKLTEGAVRRMRERRAAGWAYQRIADAEGVSLTLSWKVVTGRLWRHV